jgi:AraC-like DNA-binding protein
MSIEGRYAMKELQAHQDGCYLPSPPPNVNSLGDLGDVEDIEHRFETLQVPASLLEITPLRLSSRAGRSPASRAIKWGCGTGRVGQVTSNCAVWRNRGLQEDGLSRTFSVVAQIDGDDSYIGQGGRRCRLASGALCLVDGALSFQIEPSGDHYTHLVLSLPRDEVLRRFPHLRSSTALLLDASEAGNLLYRQMMIESLRHVARLDAEQRRATLEALFRMLGVLKPAPQRGIDGPVEAALRLIEERLHHPQLCAETVAREVGISRRRLDERFMRACGLPVASHIMQRRMREAASNLVDPSQSLRSIRDIATALGYQDAAHFARVFRRCHGMTASAWRAAGIQK